jgi:hypothetical protein
VDASTRGRARWAGGVSMGSQGPRRPGPAAPGVTWLGRQWGHTCHWAGLSAPPPLSAPLLLCFFVSPTSGWCASTSACLRKGSRLGVAGGGGRGGDEVSLGLGVKPRGPRLPLVRARRNERDNEEPPGGAYGMLVKRLDVHPSLQPRGPELPGLLPSPLHPLPVAKAFGVPEAKSPFPQPLRLLGPSGRPAHPRRLRPGFPAVVPLPCYYAGCSAGGGHRLPCRGALRASCFGDFSIFGAPCGLALPAWPCHACGLPPGRPDAPIGSPSPTRAPPPPLIIFSCHAGRVPWGRPH